jgi:YVTN family beta-propeller protein
MLALSPDGMSLYVTLRDNDQLAMLTTADLAVVMQVATGVEPHGLTYRP